MKVIITGGTGFIGQRLAARLLGKGTLTGSDGEPHEITKLVVCDIANPPGSMPDDPRLEICVGDLGNPDLLKDLITTDTGVIFHLAAVVSGGAEEDFDLGMRVNLRTTQALLETCRALGTKPRFVFASSVAVYGGDMPPIIGDGTALVPQTSYGAQKAISELLINDYSRKGFLDGRALRLPTVVVRPGKPNKAASSFASAIIREPLRGGEIACPVSADTRMWIISPRKAVEAFVHAAELPAADLGMHRSVALPGMTVSVQDMLDAMGTVAGDSVTKRVRFEPDPFIEQIVYGWATEFSLKRGVALGFKADSNATEIIEAFIEDDLDGTFVS